jgi:hypothetical protein
VVCRPTDWRRRAALAGGKSSTVCLPSSLCRLLAAFLSACAGDPTIPDNAPRPDLNVTVRVPPPPQNVFIRASFDDNPKSFVGRFVPDQLPRTEIDENRAAKTRCTEFIKIEEVNASGSFDSTYNGSNAVSANLGVVPIASAELNKSSEGVLRVKYTLKKKMRANVEDPAGLDRLQGARPVRRSSSASSGTARARSR